jgi:hypothetical protein
VKTEVGNIEEVQEKIPHTSTSFFPRAPSHNQDTWFTSSMGILRNDSSYCNSWLCRWNICLSAPRHHSHDPAMFMLSSRPNWNSFARLFPSTLQSFISPRMMWSTICTSALGVFRIRPLLTTDHICPVANST